MPTMKFPVRIGAQYRFEWADSPLPPMDLCGVVLRFVHDGGYDPTPDGIEIEEWRDGAPTGKRPMLFGPAAFNITPIP